MASSVMKGQVPAANYSDCFQLPMGCNFKGGNSSATHKSPGLDNALSSVIFSVFFRRFRRVTRRNSELDQKSGWARLKSAELDKDFSTVN